LFRVEPAQWLAQLPEVSPDLVSASEANRPQASQTLRWEGSAQLGDITVSNLPRITIGPATDAPNCVLEYGRTM
jgi:hypothetical protein